MTEIRIPPTLKNLNDSAEVPLLDLYEYLRQFHLSESLYEIGSINAIFKYGFEKPVTANIPDRIVHLLNQTQASGIDSQQLVITLTKLARFLLLSGAHDQNDQILVFGSPEFNTAYNAVRLIFDEDVEAAFPDKGKGPSILARIAASQRPIFENRLTLIARAFLLFKDIPLSLDTDYRFDEKMQEYFALTVEEFIWSGLAVWFMTNGTMHITMENEVPGLKQMVTRDTIDRFLTLSTGSPAEYKESFRGAQIGVIDKRTEYYALDPLIKMPIIKPERLLRLSNGTRLVPQAKYLQDRTCNGIFHLLAKKEEDIAVAKGAKEENPFRRAFGNVFKEYVLRQLSSANTHIKVLDLDKEFPNPNEKIPDIALVYGSNCLLLEVKTTILSLSARTYFNTKDLEQAISKKKNNFEKALYQLNTFSNAILNGSITHSEFGSIKHVAKLLVCYDDTPFLNLLMLPILKEKFGDVAQNLQIATVTDIERIADILQKNLDLPKIILDKIADSERRYWMISIYLSNKHPHTGHNLLLKNRYRELMKSIGISLKD